MIRPDLILFREWLRNARSIMKPYWSYRLESVFYRPKRTAATWLIPAINYIKVDMYFDISQAVIITAGQRRDFAGDRFSWWRKSPDVCISIADPNVSKQIAYSVNKLLLETAKITVNTQFFSEKLIQYKTILRDAEAYNANFIW